MHFGGKFHFSTVVRLAVLRMETALCVCANSAPAAVDIEASIAVTRSAGEEPFGMIEEEELQILFELLRSLKTRW